MLQIEENEEIHLCINCDAEFVVSRIDDELDGVSFCPFCGYDINSDSEDVFDDEEDNYN